MEDIYQQVLYFETIFYKIIETDKNFVWDIYLSFTNNYRAEIQAEDSPLSSDQKSRVLDTFLPSYLWIAKGRVEGAPVIEFIFDATGIHYADNYCIDVLFLDERLQNLLEDTVNIPETYSKEKFLDISAISRLVSRIHINKSNNIWGAIRKVLAIKKEDQATVLPNEENLDAKKDRWRNNIAKVEISNTIEEIKQYCQLSRRKFRNNIISLSTRYHDLKRKDIQGTISSEEYGITHHKIVEDLLNLIDDL